MWFVLVCFFDTVFLMKIQTTIHRFVSRKVNSWTSSVKKMAVWNAVIIWWIEINTKYFRQWLAIENLNKHPQQCLCFPLSLSSSFSDNQNTIVFTVACSRPLQPAPVWVLLPSSSSSASASALTQYCWLQMLLHFFLQFFNFNTSAHCCWLLLTVTA